MSWSFADYDASFEAEVGEASSFADQALRLLWYNEGQARLVRKRSCFVDVTWAAGARSVAIQDPDNPDQPKFLQLDKIVWDEDASSQSFRVWGDTLIIESSSGATSSGGARLYYWGEFAPLAGVAPLMVAVAVTETTQTEDYACLYYALSRFYRRLASNRTIYTRYSTLLGQNAVSMSDLQQEYERYYQDFLDSREDVEPKPPAYFYETFA